MNMEKGQTLGEWIAPMLSQIEDAVWSYELYVPNTPPQYSDESFRCILKLFMSAMMDKIWHLQEGEDMDIEDRVAMVEKCGKEVRALVKTYCDIETQELYNEKD